MFDNKTDVLTFDDFSALVTEIHKAGFKDIPTY